MNKLKECADNNLLKVHMDLYNDGKISYQEALEYSIYHLIELNKLYEKQLIDNLK